jgi:hypothetical protein
MSSISLSLKMMLAASACAGLTLLACGDDDSGGGSTKSDDDSSSPKDAGKGKDAGKADAGKKADAAAVELVNEGDECDPEAYGGLGNFGGACEGCDKSPCLAKCEEGAYGECRNASEVIAEFTRDGGLGNFLRDSSFSLPDTGIKRTDAGITIPTGDGGTTTAPTTECPSTLECSGELGSIIGMADVKLCVDSKNPTLGGLGPAAPPSCTTSADCAKAGLTNAVCQMVQPIGSICFAICK